MRGGRAQQGHGPRVLRTGALRGRLLVSVRLVDHQRVGQLEHALLDALEFVAGGRLAFDQPGRLTLNTDGGGLSSNHPGMRGIFLLIEATRQLRGESTSQVPDARIALAHGNGGMLGSTHTGGTVIMARD